MHALLCNVQLTQVIIYLWSLLSDKTSLGFPECTYTAELKILCTFQYISPFPVRGFARSIDLPQQGTFISTRQIFASMKH